jgi:mono/diheme cytochrome c family protein
MSLGLCLAAALPHSALATPPPSGTPKHWPVLQKYCVECHNTEDWAGGVAFDALGPETIGTEAETWEKAVRKLRTGMMPPPGEARPQRTTLDRFASEIATRLDQSAAARPFPGTKSLHRLNRAEYANAVRDLIAYRADVTTLLPADNASEGFDNIADVLGVSPTLIQGYVSAAMKISRGAIGDRSMAPSLAKYTSEGGQDRPVEGLPLGTRGGVLFTHDFPLDAEYEFRVSAGPGFRFAGPAGGPPPLIDVTLNGAAVQVDDPRKFRLRVKAGPQTVAVALVDRRHAEGVDDLYARGTVRPDSVDSVTINGPFDATGAGDTPSRRAIFTCRPTSAAEESACAKDILTRLAGRAFRRPMQPDDAAVATLMSFYDAARRSGGDFENGMQRALARLLCDPQFIYRVEGAPANVGPGQAYRISDIELASRLSFFLWSSIPDDTLLQLASAKRLSDPAMLDQQVRRMLQDARAQSFIENFAGQWLHLRELRNAQPADRAFDDSLRRAFEQETQLLFASVVHEDRSFVDLLDADYTFVNERLANHYGIEGVHGTYMRRVPLARDAPRRGLLGQGSILTVTSAGNRTSPVMRGAWVMENLLGAPVPRPPPGVEADLKEDASSGAPTTVRARLEKHRAEKTCAACHQIMDPIGFSLENFDLVGRWRDKDGESPVDSSGTLVDGTRLEGVQDLRQALLSRSDAFVTSGTERLMTYALGRRLEAYDYPTIRRIVEAARRDDYRFTSLVLGIVKSAPFQMKVQPQ